MINILVTGAGSTLGYGILKCLKSSSLDCRVIGTDYFDTAVGLYWVDERYILPDLLSPAISESHWLDKIGEVIIREKIDVVLIGLDFEVPVFAKHREALESRYGCKIVVSPEPVVTTCFDKWHTYEFLKENDLNAPSSCLIDGVSEFREQVGFPWIVKPRTGSTSKNLFKVHNEEEVAHALANCPNPIIQRCIGTDDEEFTCGTVSIEGEVLSHIALKRTLRAGNTAVAFCEDYPEVEAAIVKVTEKLQPYGPINIQLRLTSEGPTVFEINPRFSGTTPLRMQFGLNEVEMLLQYLITKENPPKILPKHGVIIRYTEEYFVSAEDFGSATRL